MNRKQKRPILAVVSIAFMLLMIGSVVAELFMSNVKEKAEDASDISSSSSSSSGSGSFGVTAKVVGDTDTASHVTETGPEPVIFEERPSPEKLPDLIISPSRQVTSDGIAEYKIIFRDPHINGCMWESEDSIACPATIVIPLELGDVNNDGVVDQNDLDYLTAYLFKGGPKPLPLIPDNVKSKRGDINQDGIVNVGDVVALVNFLQGRGSTTVVYQKYTYSLSFATLTSQPIQGSFEQNEFTLGAGESFITTLTVKADKEGANPFSVSVQEVDGDYVTRANGVVIYTPNSYQDVSFFVGQGFILNQGETQGGLIDLTILKKDSKLTGKATIEGNTFRLEGEALPSPAPNNLDADSRIAVYSGATYMTFDLYHPKINGAVFSFTGSVKQFNSFKLLEGNLKDFNGQTWSLTAFGKKEFSILSSTEQGQSVEVGVNEIMIVQDQVSSTATSTGAGATTIASSAGESGVGSTGEVYIRLIEVYRKKIFGIFPVGRRVVDFELIKPGEVIEKTISEDSTENVGGYTISVGSLADKESIEMSIQID